MSTYRVIGYTRNGTVVDTIVCDEHGTEAAHDKLMEHPRVSSCMTMGPFPTGKSQ